MWIYWFRLFFGRGKLNAQKAQSIKWLIYVSLSELNVAFLSYSNIIEWNQITENKRCLRSFALFFFLFTFIITNTDKVFFFVLRCFSFVRNFYLFWFDTKHSKCKKINQNFCCWMLKFKRLLSGILLLSVLVTNSIKQRL